MRQVRLSIGKKSRLLNGSNRGDGSADGIIAIDMS